MRIQFDQVRHAYNLDGLAVPSVTQVLDPLNDWSGIDPWVLERARAVGSEVHAAVNLMVRGVLDWDSLDDLIACRVRGAQRYIEESGIAVIASEVQVASAGLRVAGTLDVIAHLNGWEYFIDWKVTEAVPNTVGAQLAAYERLYTETFRRGRKAHRVRRLCVRLLDDDYRVDVMRSPDRDYSLFLSALNTYNHRMRKHG